MHMNIYIYTYIYEYIYIMYVNVIAHYICTCYCFTKTHRASFFDITSSHPQILRTQILKYHTAPNLIFFEPHTLKFHELTP